MQRLDMLLGIHRCGRAEDKPPNPMLAKHTQQTDEPGHIDVKVTQRVGHRFGNRLQACKMKTGIHRTFSQHAVDTWCVTHINVEMRKSAPGHAPNALIDLRAAIDMIIQRNHLVALLQQSHQHVASDIAGGAGDKNGHSGPRPY